MVKIIYANECYETCRYVAPLGFFALPSKRGDAENTKVPLNIKKWLIP